MLMPTEERVSLVNNILKVAPQIFTSQELHRAPTETLKKVLAALNGSAAGLVQNCNTKSQVMTNEDWLPTPSVIGDPNSPKPVFRPAYANGGLTANEDEDWLPIPKIIQE
jgi:hypothetical protein